MFGFVFAPVTNRSTALAVLIGAGPSPRFGHTPTADHGCADRSRCRAGGMQPPGVRW